MDSSGTMEWNNPHPEKTPAAKQQFRFRAAAAIQKWLQNMQFWNDLGIGKYMEIYGSSGLARSIQQEANVKWC